MAYLHIENLYKNPDIFLFKECFATEKIHGTSAHISFQPDGELRFFSGGVKHEDFIKLFDHNKLRQDFLTQYPNFQYPIIVFGEAYGGKCQKMSATYGKELRFVAFEVKMGDNWLDVPNAEQVATNLGFDFVHYVKIPTTIEALNMELNNDSMQAVKNGMGTGHKREGIVIRPLMELKKNNGERIIVKHKRDDFKETKTPRNLEDKLKVLTEAKEIATEWVTPMRLHHVLDKLGKEIVIENMGDVIKNMVEDIERESVGEIVLSKTAKKEIGKETARLFKEYLINYR